MKKTTPTATKTVYPIICQTVNTIPTQFGAETAKAHKPSGMAKDLYWKTFNYLVGIAPKFGKGPHRGYCCRVKAPMFAVEPPERTYRTFDLFDGTLHNQLPPLKTT